MLSPQQQKYADRLNELIHQGENLTTENRPVPSSFRLAGSRRAAATVRSESVTVLTLSDPRQVHSWWVSVKNIFVQVFGSDSVHSRTLLEYTTAAPTNLDSVGDILGIMEGALADLQGGYLQGQEFIIAAELFDSTLERARHLLDAGHLDCASVLGRVVLEDALKRLANKNSISVTDVNGRAKKASILNTELKGASVYNQPQWRYIDGWLDTGNLGAHPTGHPLTKDDVTKLLDGVEQFLASHFNP